MVAPTNVIQQFIPQLAASLGQIRRVPGKGDAWIGHVIEALAKGHDPRNDKMRRRIGFAQRLATIADLSDVNMAPATLGLFFHGLLPPKANGARGARPWREYLLRNEEWLRPALEMCEIVDRTSWEGIETAPEIVAKITVIYDTGTLERHERPLAVVESLMEEVDGHPAQAIVELLWTEDGQALSDHHFRRHPRGYRLDPKDIKASLARLYRVTPRAAPAVAVQSMRFGDAPAHETNEQEVEQPVAQGENQNGASENFDKRKSALRQRKDEPELEVASSETHEADSATLVDIPSGIEAKLREMEAKEQQDAASKQLVRPDLTVISEIQAPALEEPMNQMTAVAPTSRHDALDVRERLQDLRIQLGQIQQIAAQAEQLLAGIAPQIDEFATRIADVEAVMDRWSTRPRVAA